MPLKAGFHRRFLGWGLMGLVPDRLASLIGQINLTGSRSGGRGISPTTSVRNRAALDEGRGVREAARLLKVSAAKVSKVRRMSATTTAG